MGPRIGSGAMPDLVLAEDRGPVRHLVLNRPDKRNALNLDLALAIRHGFRDAADDPSGGVVVLALACDLRVFAEDAVAGLIETRLGLVPDLGGSSRLPQVVGVGRAKELIMTSRVIGAEEAERFGLANRVAPAERLDAVTGELVDELLACAPVAIGLAKRLVDASARPALSTTLELELAAQRVCVATEDVKEG